MAFISPAQYPPRSRLPNRALQCLPRLAPRSLFLVARGSPFPFLSVSESSALPLDRSFGCLIWLRPLHLVILVTIWFSKVVPFLSFRLKRGPPFPSGLDLTYLVCSVKDRESRSGRIGSCVRCVCCLCCLCLMNCLSGNSEDTFP